MMESLHLLNMLVLSSGKYVKLWVPVSMVDYSVAKVTAQCNTGRGCGLGIFFDFWKNVILDGINPAEKRLSSRFEEGAGCQLTSKVFNSACRELGILEYTKKE